MSVLRAPIAPLVRAVAENDHRPARLSAAPVRCSHPEKTRRASTGTQRGGLHETSCRFAAKHDVAFEMPVSPQHPSRSNKAVRPPRKLISTSGHLTPELTNSAVDSGPRGPSFRCCRRDDARTHPRTRQ